MGREEARPGTIAKDRRDVMRNGETCRSQRKTDVDGGDPSSLLISGKCTPLFPHCRICALGGFTMDDEEAQGESERGNDQHPTHVGGKLAP